MNFDLLASPGDGIVIGIVILVLLMCQYVKGDAPDA